MQVTKNWDEFVQAQLAIKIKSMFVPVGFKTKLVFVQAM